MYLIELNEYNLWNNKIISNKFEKKKWFSILNDANKEIKIKNKNILKFLFFNNFHD